eukprot:CAMPEP_0172195370 /NCGR_PEP_ID=MMETSP1050-20130122/26162_1 /TAXON_ID=233186 /ORGANISM="Cryptomonas curvata, Strain CCAP979/52" /LENGTH=147 /DNA_ID=CAMNT_0012871409 /DNA_START=532 /DNA_END=975 /DNA_ORIENTATION=+
MTMDPSIFSTCRVVSRAGTATPHSFPAAEIPPWIPSGSSSMRQRARGRPPSVESVARSRSSPDPNPRWTLTRSCAQLDGVNRKVITLPASWAPIANNVKSEKFAQDQVNRRLNLQLLQERPKPFMRVVDRALQSHPDSPWQPLRLVC